METEWRDAYKYFIDVMYMCRRSPIGVNERAIHVARHMQLGIPVISIIHLLHSFKNKCFISQVLQIIILSCIWCTVVLHEGERRRRELVLVGLPVVKSGVPILVGLRLVGLKSLKGNQEEQVGMGAAINVHVATQPTEHQDASASPRDHKSLTYNRLQQQLSWCCTY